MGTLGGARGPYARAKSAYLQASPISHVSIRLNSTVPAVATSTIRGTFAMHQWTAPSLALHFLISSFNRIPSSFPLHLLPSTFLVSMDSKFTGHQGNRNLYMKDCHDNLQRKLFYTEMRLPCAVSTRALPTAFRIVRVRSKRVACIKSGCNGSGLLARKPASH